MKGKSHALPRDHLIILPPQRRGSIAEFIDFTFGWLWHWCFPQIQAGVYRGWGLTWHGFPDGEPANAPTRLLLWKILSNQIGNVKTIDITHDE